MKKAIAIVSVLLILLALAACNKEVSDTQNEKITEPKEQIPPSEEKTIQISVCQRHLKCSAYGIGGTYPVITFSEEYQNKYPKIWKELSGFNEDWRNTIETFLSEYALYKEGYVINNIHRGEITASFKRIDDAIITLYISDYSKAIKTDIINYDAQTQRKLSLIDVLQDKNSLTESFRKELEKSYAAFVNSIKEYVSKDNTEYEDIYEYIFSTAKYTWYINEDGLCIHFPAGEIAPYKDGKINIVLNYADYPDLIKEKYRYKNDDWLSYYIYEDEEIQEITIEELPQYFNPILLPNPSWDYYVTDGQCAARNHISLKKSSEIQKDYVDFKIWAADHGFQLVNPHYEDDNYIYYPIKYNDTDNYWFNYYSELHIYSKKEEKIIYAYNLNDLCNGPDLLSGKSSNTRQYLYYGKIVDNILYMAIGCTGYSTEEPKSNYLVAIDLNTNEILFKTEPLTVNSKNFVIIDDTIICGYGFTDETDWIYLLDRYTGERVGSILVNSWVEQFNEKNGVLYVVAYDTEYEFRIIK